MTKLAIRSTPSPLFKFVKMKGRFTSPSANSAGIGRAGLRGCYASGSMLCYLDITRKRQICSWRSLCIQIQRPLWLIFLGDRSASPTLRYVCLHDAHDNSTGSDHLGWPKGGRGISSVVERISRLGNPLVLFRDKETRQEHLLAMRGLDGNRHCRHCRSFHLWIA
jgi:hypothetical protein